MRRPLATLLIPLVLAGQSLSAPHSHAGKSVGEPEGHLARPHIHLDGGKHHHGHHSHEHHDGDELPATAPPHVPADHDSDAVYLPSTQLINDAKPTRVADADVPVACVIFDDAATTGGLRLWLGRGSPPQLVNVKCPLYLRTLSIRC